MLISDVCKKTNLTKKAILYYIEQDLINPEILENGYKNFNDGDIETLKKISVLRKLNIPISEIKKFLENNNFESLQKIALKQKFEIENENKKQSLLNNLIDGKNWESISNEIDKLEKNNTILNKLTDAFPNYYGRYICLHFSRFLDCEIEIAENKEQKDAYDTIIDFLDNAPDMEFSDGLKELLQNEDFNMNNDSIVDIIKNTESALGNIDNYMEENKKSIHKYLEFKNSEEFKNSPIFELQNVLKNFNESSGYYETFIPAMKRLSKSYAKYHDDLESAEQKFSGVYKDI